jgi:hypothetical protein
LSHSILPVIPEGAGPVNPSFFARDLSSCVLRLLVGALR